MTIRGAKSIAEYKQMQRDEKEAIKMTPDEEKRIADPYTLGTLEYLIDMANDGATADELRDRMTRLADEIWTRINARTQE